MDRRRRADEGFTLVELLVTVLVLGILAGLTIPTLLHQKAKAYSSSLKGTLHLAASVQEMWATEQGAYTTNVADLELRGFRLTDRVDVAVSLIPGGYCMTAEQLDSGQRLYLSNVGPAAGRPTTVAC